VASDDRKDFVVGQAGTLSFQAANFQSGRDTWIFQPVINWGDISWETSGTPIQNTFQQETYTDIDDIILNAPFLQYRLFFPEKGTYDLWGYGYTGSSTAIYWGFDSDDTHLRSFSLGDDSSGWEGVPKWTKFGTFFIEAGGEHTFEVYLGNNTTALLDQWYFTTNINLTEELSEVGLDIPLPQSKGPFNTVVRLRSLAGQGLDSLLSPSSGGAVVSAWLSSTQMLGSGKFNYEIREYNTSNESGVTFTDGVSIEYWQAGGNEDFFASWNYIFPSNNLGSTFVSQNNGEVFSSD